ncbi:MAG: hypothetical protein M1838_004421 [Thelocarpon superellum]|nr:MAG: hypothetical protein M1838_004421 [Thelocarpon superellum]
MEEVARDEGLPDGRSTPASPVSGPPAVGALDASIRPALSAPPGTPEVNAWASLGDDYRTLHSGSASTSERASTLEFPTHAPSPQRPPVDGVPRLERESPGPDHVPSDLSLGSLVRPSAHTSTVPIPTTDSSPSLDSPQPSISSSSREDASSSTFITTFPPIDAATESLVPVPTAAPPLIEPTTIPGRRDFPVYPNQAFSVLHSQVHPPPYLPRPQRTRSSHASQFSSSPATASMGGRQRSGDFGPGTDIGSKTAGHTPAASPGLFHPPAPTSSPSLSGDDGLYGSAFLHWTQKQPPKETHVADKDIDPVSGRKLLNQYEIIDELGRGVHGKVKLGRNLETGVEVAIKIVARYSKRRRLGKLGNPEDKVKKEVAILKKARHPNVVALLEVIDDPAIMKVYIVLEFVELGEIVWRVKGAKDVVKTERRRVEREARGESGDEVLEERVRQEPGDGAATNAPGGLSMPFQSTDAGYWSLEYGGNHTDDEASTPASPAPVPSETLAPTIDTTPHEGMWSADRPPSPAPLAHDRLRPSHPSQDALRTAEDLYHTADDGLTSHDHTFGVGGDFFSYSADELAPTYDPYDDDFSYVPCLTLEQARQTFRDTILGLEYLHYQGIIHRDIKPANLLWTADHHVKISDFGVSYLGRPIRDDDTIEDLAEADAQPLDEAVELAKTVGTPAFYAPELCYTDLTTTRPAVTGQIDVWALGVTLYCLLFARLPFRAEDEYSLFKAISEEEVFIPSRRLKSVHPHQGSHSSSHTSMSPIVTGDFRPENELVYEEIDGDLYDLLKRILAKDPTKRITLKEVKRHPFTLQGISDPIRWIDETDSSRQNEGRKIEVSTEDVEKAVVSIGFLERVRSGMRKVGQAIGFGKAREGRRRMRGNASATEGSSESVSPTPTLKDRGRSSPRDDDAAAFGGRSRDGEHPLSQSVTASPDVSDSDHFFPHDEGGTDPVATPTTTTTLPLGTAVELIRPQAPERAISTSAASIKTVTAPDQDTALWSPNLLETTTIEPRTSTSPHPHVGGIFGGAVGMHVRGALSRDLTETDGVSSNAGPTVIPASVEESRAEASVAISNASAAGQVHSPSLPTNVAPAGTSIQPGALDSQASSALITPQLLKTFLGAPVEADPPVGAARTFPIRPLSAATAWRRASVVSESGPVRAPLSDSGADVKRSRVRPSSSAGADLGVRHPFSYLEQNGGGSRAEVGSDKVAADAAAAPSSDVNYPLVSSPSGPIASSSSDDRLTSGMSQSTSYPSVPSVISAGSSVDTDDAATHLAKHHTVLPALPTDETLTPDRPHGQHDANAMGSDDDPGYNGDHGGDDEEDSDDEDFLVMTRHRAQGPVAEKMDESPRSSSCETGGTARTARSGSTGTLKTSPGHETDEHGEAAASPAASTRGGCDGVVG